MRKNDKPDWINRGKTIKQLIKELQSFDDLNMEVKLSIDDGETEKAISLVEKKQGVCLLVHCD